MALALALAEWGRRVARGSEVIEGDRPGLGDIVGEASHEGDESPKGDCWPSAWSVKCCPSGLPQSSDTLAK
jgi:hypothetical protein